jgi:hypothetical protein
MRKQTVSTIEEKRRERGREREREEKSFDGYLPAMLSLHWDNKRTKQPLECFSFLTSKNENMRTSS